MTTLKWNEFFKVTVDVYKKDTTEIDARLAATGFEFTKVIVNWYNGRTNYTIKTAPAFMPKLIEILTD